jgi:hypothetical protein
MAGYLREALILVAVGSAITAVQRILHVRGLLAAQTAGGPGRKKAARRR